MPKPMTLKQKEVLRRRLQAAADELTAALALMDSSPAFEDGESWVYTATDNALGNANTALEELEQGRKT